jgi:hypothetical protein
MTEKEKIFPFCRPAITIRYVAGKRNGGAPQLIGQAKSFGGRERRSEFVDCKTQLNCPLPHDKILEGRAHFLPSSLAMPYSSTRAIRRDIGIDGRARKIEGQF